MSISAKEMLAYDVQYGILCRKCKKAKALVFSWSFDGRYTSIQWKCNRCQQLSDTLHLTSYAREVLDNA